MKKKIIAMLLSVVMAVSLTACGSGSGAGKEKDTNISSELTYDHSMELTYAEEFSVDYYNDGYALATVADDGRYLIVPEGYYSAQAAADQYLSGGIGSDGYVCIY